MPVQPQGSKSGIFIPVQPQGSKSGIFIPVQPQGIKSGIFMLIQANLLKIKQIKSNTLKIESNPSIALCTGKLAKLWGVTGLFKPHSKPSPFDSVCLALVILTYKASTISKKLLLLIREK